MATKHFKEKEFREFHECASKTTETSTGGCLWGHKGGYSKSSCCYRWQAHEVAKTDPQKSKFHSYSQVTIPPGKKTSAYKAKSGAMYPSHYCSEIEPPEKGDWDVDGPLETITRETFKGKVAKIKRLKNFTKDTWPWWNNAHHLIPKGTLISKIGSETEADPTVGLIIKQALMVATYNVNHKVNMMFLPQDLEIGVILKLPRHLVLKHKDGPGGLPSCFDHKSYNRMVAKDLTKIIGQYKKKAKDAKDSGKPHPEINAEIDKTRLEKLSGDLLKKIMGFKGYGMPLDNMYTP